MITCNSALGAPTAIIEEAGSDVKNCLVRSCTECSRDVLEDGTVNIAGMTHRALMTKTITNIHGTTSWLDCSNCPVFTGMTEQEWDNILAEIDGCE